MGPDDSPMLGFFEDVHHRAIAGGPIFLGHAVHQENIDVVDAQFAAEAVEIGAHFCGIAGPGFGEDGDFAAIDLLQSFGDMRMAAVGISRVKKTKPLVVAVQ